MKVDLSEISVIVQGPVVGAKALIKEDRLTQRCLASIRQHLPKATIILSTWNDQNTAGLDCDVIIKSEDPGYSYTVLDNLNPNEVREDSSNRQILSTKAGLEKCTTRYAIKMRSDLVLTGTGFVEYFENFSEFPTDLDFKILEKRVVLLTTCNPKRKHKFPFTAADWFFFGQTSDLRKIFDIPSLETRGYRSESNNGKTVYHAPFSTEQYIWCSFISKYKALPFRHVSDATEENILLSEKYFANNSILLPATKANVDWLKYPKAAYAQIPSLSNTGLYTWNEYLKMLNEHAKGNIKIKDDILEKISYSIVYNGRNLVKKILPDFHDMIARLINREIHKKLQSGGLDIKRLVIWGLRKKYHTHRHIHQSFYKNAKKLGLDVIWVEDEMSSQKYIQSGDLIIAAEVHGKMVPQKTRSEDYHLPVRDDVFYCLHNYRHDLFTNKLRQDQYINLQFYSNEPEFSVDEEYWSPVTIFDKATQTLYQPWGTDLLASEFKPPVFNRNRLVFWIGSIWNDSQNRGNIEAIAELKKALSKHNLKFWHLRFIPDFLNLFFIRQARVAPAIAGRHQVKVDYLPCRVFKNISYGQLGITNVPKFKELLGESAIPGDTIEQLIDNALQLDEAGYKQKVIEQQAAIKQYTYKESLINITRALKSLRI